MTFEQLETLVESAKELLGNKEDLGAIHEGINEYMLNMEACYQAMLDVQDHAWRLDHQAELVIARSTLADILGLDNQVVQEYYETIAMRKRQAKQEVCF